MSELSLQQEWQHLLALSGLPSGSAIPALEDLTRAYSEPHRHYHTLDHLHHVLDLLKQARYEDCAGLWAVWYHDYIYEPGRSDNEEKSARRATQVMGEHNLEASLIDRTAAIIIATRNHQAGSADEACQMMLDANMAILGVPESDYERYCQAVRQEFSKIPAMAYRMGRKGFIKQLLEQEKIFHTPYFYDQFEAQARRNLARELKDLT